MSMYGHRKRIDYTLLFGYALMAIGIIGLLWVFGLI